MDTLVSTKSARQVRLSRLAAAPQKYKGFLLKASEPPEQVL